jgi:hypothetical protein
MKDKYNYVCKTVEEESNMKKVLYDIMSIVNDENKHHKVKVQDLNIDVLQRAKIYFIRKYNLILKNNKPNSQSLSRDQKLFGNREISTMAMIPSNSRPLQGEEDKEYLMDRLISEREIDIKKPNVPDELHSQNEMPESTEDFMKKLQSLELERKQVNDDIQQTRIQQSKDFIEMNTLDKQSEARKAFYTQLPPKLHEDKPFEDGKELTVIPRNLKHKIIDKYLSVNSFDRDILSNPYRYSYSINFQTKDNDIQNRYRNIDSLSVSKVIIPDEIIQFNDPIKTTFNYEFTFNYPYLLLQIDEFADIYDGTNNSIRKTFCKLVYYQSYKSQNGRGYIVLKTSQNEKKHFYPAPLTALTKFTISLLKPNGDLFNKSADNYNILQISYTINLLQITTNLYFDENEFYINDSVVFINYLMTNISPSMNDFDIQTFNKFINSTHVIIKLGTPNTNGYYNSFFIQAPGSFDKSVGQFTINSSLITCLSNYNTALGTPVVNGNIINSSLQHSIAMQVNMIVDDARLIDAQNGFNF